MRKDPIFNQPELARRTRPLGLGKANFVKSFKSKKGLIKADNFKKNSYLIKKFRLFQTLLNAKKGIEAKGLPLLNQGVSTTPRLTEYENLDKRNRSFTHRYKTTQAKLLSTNNGRE